MKQLATFILLAFAITFSQAQSPQSEKKVIINDSIYVMGLTNGRAQLLLPAPVAGQSIIVHTIDIRYKVNARLYSPEQSEVDFEIGYQQGSNWNQVCSFPWTNFNKKANTTYYMTISLAGRIWEATETDAAPLMIRLSHPMNFESGSNRLTLYITYRVLN